MTLVTLVAQPTRHAVSHGIVLVTVGVLEQQKSTHGTVVVLATRQCASMHVAVLKEQLLGVAVTVAM